MKLRIISFLAAALLAPAVLHGQARDDQFKKDAFSQNYTDTSKQAKADSSQLFSFRQYFGSLAHKRPETSRTWPSVPRSSWAAARSTTASIGNCP